MKKITIAFIIIIMFVAIVMAQTTTQMTTEFVASSQITPQPEIGTVKLNVSSLGYAYLKAIIAKGEVEYIYNLVENIESFPLQMESGKYNVTILGSNDGRSFRVLTKETINVIMEKDIVFLSTNQVVFWNVESKVVILTKELIKDAKNDQEKFNLIHNYVINNISYDYNKASVLPRGYVPSPDATIEAGSGICYDFAALTASMLRSANIHTKLVKGYSTFTPVYHAWNEVFIDGQWIVIDTSSDSIFAEANVDFIVNKNVSDYLTSKVY